MSVVLATAILAVSFYGGYSTIVTKGLVIIIAGIPATSAVLCFQSVLIASGRGAELGGIQGIEAVARTISGIILICFTRNILPVIVGFIIFRWLINAIYWHRVKPLKSNYKWRIKTKFFNTFLKTTPQFAGILTLFLIIRFAGQIMVPWIEGDTAAGYFAIVYQFLDLILLVPSAFTINLMPILSRKAEISVLDLTRTCNQAMKLISFLILPCTLFIFVNCESIISIIFGVQYNPSVLLVRVSIWTGLIFSLDQVLSTSMIAAGKQGVELASRAGGALVTIVAMYILISTNGVTGAAEGLLIGTLALFCARIIFYTIKISVLNLPAIIWRQVIAGISMAVSLFLLRSNIIISGFTGGMIYFLVLFCLGGFNRNERFHYTELLGNN